MADYLIWARVEQISPRKFAAVVSAAPAGATYAPQVKSEIRPTREEANAVRERLAVEMTKFLRVLGHEVLNVQVE